LYSLSPPKIIKIQEIFDFSLNPINPPSLIGHDPSIKPNLITYEASLTSNIIPKDNMAKHLFSPMTSPMTQQSLPISTLSTPDNIRPILKPSPCPASMDLASDERFEDIIAELLTSAKRIAASLMRDLPDDDFATPELDIWLCNLKKQQTTPLKKKGS